METARRGIGGGKWGGEGKGGGGEERLQNSSLSLSCICFLSPCLIFEAAAVNSNSASRFANALGIFHLSIPVVGRTNLNCISLAYSNHYYSNYGVSYANLCVLWFYLFFCCCFMNR